MLCCSFCHRQLHCFKGIVFRHRNVILKTHGFFVLPNTTVILQDVYGKGITNSLEFTNSCKYLYRGNTIRYFKNFPCRQHDITKLTECLTFN